MGVGQNKGQWPGLDDSTGILMNRNGTVSTAQMRRMSLESARQVMGAPAPPPSGEMEPPPPGQSWPGLANSSRGSRRSTGATSGVSRRGSGGSNSSGGSGNGASDLDDSETMRMYRKQQSGISSTVKAGYVVWQRHYILNCKIKSLQNKSDPTTTRSPNVGTRPSSRKETYEGAVSVQRARVKQKEGTRARIMERGMRWEWGGRAMRAMRAKAIWLLVLEDHWTL